jgi:SpoVK/Ycf46/Vps4 family AAA+-type ATPase
MAVADAAHGFVGADLAALCSEAAMVRLRRQVVQTDANAMTVTRTDFEAAETRVRPSGLREINLEVPKVLDIVVSFIIPGSSIMLLNVSRCPGTTSGGWTL